MTSIRIYVKNRKISQKVSAIPICRLEWGSQDPPLFPGLLSSVTAHASRSDQFAVLIHYTLLYTFKRLSKMSYEMHIHSQFQLISVQLFSNNGDVK